MSREVYFSAIADGDVVRLKSLLAASPKLLEERTAPVYAPERPLKCTGLHAAVYAGRAEAARVLVDSGIDIEARTTEGRTALHDSIEYGVSEITSLLLDRGANVDICSAAILGRVGRMRELLDRDPTLANDRSTGLSPLGWAAFGNQVEAATELIECGARMDDGELLCAASVGHVDVGRLLIDNGAEPNAIVGESGANALHAAAAMRYTTDSRPFVRMLLERGADPALRTAHGETALEIAEKMGAQEDEKTAGNPGTPRKRFRELAALLRERG